MERAGEHHGLPGNRWASQLNSVFVFDVVDDCEEGGEWTGPALARRPRYDTQPISGTLLPPTGSSY